MSDQFTNEPIDYEELDKPRETLFDRYDSNVGTADGARPGRRNRAHPMFQREEFTEEPVDHGLAQQSRVSRAGQHEQYNMLQSAERLAGGMRKPEEASQLIMAASYLAERTGYEPEYVFENLEHVAEEYYGQQILSENIFRTVKNAWDRGQAQVDMARVDQQLSRESWGGDGVLTEDQERRFEEAERIMAQAPPPDPQNRSWFINQVMKTVEAPTEQLPRLVRSFTTAFPEAVTFSAGAAAAAALRGLPLNAVPVLGQVGYKTSVAGAAVAGFAGSFKGYSIKRLAEAYEGATFREIMSHRLPDGSRPDARIAAQISYVAGLTAGASEMMALSHIPGASKIAGYVTQQAVANALAKSVIRNRVASAGLQWVKSVGFGVLNEVYQESAQIFGTELAKVLDAGVNDREWDRYTADEIMDRYKQIIDMSARSYGVMGIPGTVANIRSPSSPHVQQAQRTQQAVKRLGELQTQVTANIDLAEPNIQELSQRYDQLVENLKQDPNPQTYLDALGVISQLDRLNPDESTRVMSEQRQGLTMAEARQSWQLSREDFQNMQALQSADFEQKLMEAAPDITEDQAALTRSYVQIMADRMNMSFDDYLSSRLEGPGIHAVERAPGFRGGVQITMDQLTNEIKGIIHIAENADFSTFLHELFHIEERRAAGGQDSVISREDYSTLSNWARGLTGDPDYALVESGEWTMDTFVAEKIADGLEAYLVDGTVPNEQMRTLFERIADFLRKIYQDVLQGLPQLSEDTRAVFDRVFSGEQLSEIDRRSAAYPQAPGDFTETLGQREQVFVTTPEWRTRAAASLAEEKAIGDANDGRQALPPLAKTYHDLASENDRLVVTADTEAQAVERAEQNMHAEITDAFERQDPDVLAALTWYEDDIVAMRETLTQDIPELADDNYWAPFLALLGSLSSGMKPTPNVWAAASVFKYWLRSSEMPVDYLQKKNKWTGRVFGLTSTGQIGTVQGQRPVIADKLMQVQQMAKSFNFDPAAMTEWLLAEHQGVEVLDMVEAKTIDGVLKTQAANGFDMLGPKVGQFAMALWGDRNMVVKDRWFSRTWNRYMGTPWMSLGRDIDSVRAGNQDPAGLVADTPRTTVERRAMEAAVRNTAAKLSQDLGREIYPSQVQALLWFREQKMYRESGVPGITSGSYAEGATARYAQLGDRRASTSGQGFETRSPDEIVQQLTDEYKALQSLPWTDLALEILTGDSILKDNAPIYDQAPMLFQRAQVSFEAIPGMSVDNGRWEWTNALSYEQKTELLSDVMAAIRDDNGLNIIAQEFGIEGVTEVVAPGVWEDQRNPSLQLQLEYGDELTPEVIEQVEAFAAALGMLLNQEGVGWNAPIANAPLEQQNSVIIDAGRVFTLEETNVLTEFIQQNYGDEVAIVGANEGVRLLNFGDVDGGEMAAQVAAYLEAKDAIDGDVDVYRYAIEGGLVENDWRQDSNGQGYIQRLSAAGASGIYQRVASILGSKIDAAYTGFEKKYRPRPAPQSTDTVTYNQRSPLKSRLTTAATMLAQESGTAEQMLRALEKTPGVKPAEMIWTGLDDWLQQKGSEKVTRDQIVGYLEENEVKFTEKVRLSHEQLSGELPAHIQAEVDQLTRVKEDQYLKELDRAMEGTNTPDWEIKDRRALARFSAREEAAEIVRSRYETVYDKYTTGMQQNYREVLVQWDRPARFDDQSFAEYRALRDELVAKYEIDPTLGFQGIREEILARSRQGEDVAQANKDVARLSEVRRDSHSDAGPHIDYASDHWRERNVVSHIRLSDKVFVEGTRQSVSLFIEEIQSDWHQEGRKQGYHQGEQAGRLEERNEIEAELAEKVGLMRNMQNQLSEIDVEIDLELYEEVLKEEQILRRDVQDLNTQLQRLNVDEMVPQAPMEKSWHEMSMRRALLEAVENEYDSISWTTGEIQADRYSGAQISEGMGGFYDNILVKYANKLGKKFGSEVTQAEFGGRTIWQMRTTGEMRQVVKAHKVWQLPITDQMRQSIQEEGLTLFQRADAFWFDGRNVYDTDSTHIRDVLNAPERYGMTKQELVERYKAHGEKIGQEAKAREEIILELTRKNWIRARHYRKPHDYWSLTVGDMRRQKAQIEDFIFYAMENLDMNILDQLQIVSSETEMTQAWTFQQGGIQKYLEESNEFDTLNQRDPHFNAVADAVARGEWVDDAVIGEYAEASWAQEELQAREALKMEALEFQDFDEFLGFMGVADPDPHSSYYYEEIWRSAQDDPRGARAVGNAQWVESLSDEKVTTLLGAVGLARKTAMLDDVALKDIAKYVQTHKSAPPASMVQAARTVMADNPTHYRQLVSDIIGDDQELDLLVREERSDAMRVELDREVAENRAMRAETEDLRAKGKIQAEELRKFRARKPARVALRDHRKRQQERLYRKKLIRSILKDPSAAIAHEQATQIRALQSKYYTNRSQRVAELQEMMRDYADSGEPMSEQIREQLQMQRLQDLDTMELEGIREQISQLVEQGRVSRWLQILEERAEISQLSQQIAMDILQTDPNDMIDMIGSVKTDKELKSSIATEIKRGGFRPPRIARMLGRGKRGAAYQLIVTEVNAAVDAELRAIEQRTQQGTQRMEELGINPQVLAEKRATATGVEFRTDDIISIYIAMQNEDSAAAVLYGNKIPLDTVEELIGLLSAEEKEWGNYLIESFGQENYDRIVEVLVKDQNRGMPKVDRYFPMIRQGKNFEFISEAAGADLISRTPYTRAYAQKNFTKSRVKIAPQHQSPIELGATSIWMRQVAAQEKYINSGLLVKKMQRVFNDPQVTNAINKKFGRTMNEWTQKFVNDYANPDIYRTHGTLAKASRMLRNHAAMSYLGLNLVTMLKQVPSVAFYLPHAGPVHMVSAATQFAANPKSVVDFVWERDPQAKHRSLNRFQEELKTMDQEGYAGLVRRIGNVTMSGIKLMDTVAVSIGWKATFDRAVAQGMSEVEATRVAQQATLDSQPAARAKDLAELYRTGEQFNWFLMFSNQLNQIWNMMFGDIPMDIQNREIGKALATATSLAISAAAIGWLSYRDIPEDVEELPGIAGKYLRDQVVSAIPIIGGGMKAGMQGWFGSGVDPVPLASQVGRAARIMTQEETRDGQKLDAMMRVLMDAMVAGGLPTVQPRRIHDTLFAERWFENPQFDPWELIGGIDDGS